jgi:uncharacterized protein
MSDQETPVIDAGLAELLACPACRSVFRVEAARLVCQGSACGLRFEIRDGVPMLRLDMALPEGGEAR